MALLILGNFNTSNVEVLGIIKTKCIVSKSNFNTSNVEVLVHHLPSQIYNLYYFNTSNVEVLGLVHIHQLRQ